MFRAADAKHPGLRRYYLRPLRACLKIVISSRRREIFWAKSGSFERFRTPLRSVRNDKGTIFRQDLNFGRPPADAQWRRQASFNEQLISQSDIPSLISETAFSKGIGSERSRLASSYERMSSSSSRASRIFCQAEIGTTTALRLPFSSTRYCSSKGGHLFTSFRQCIKEWNHIKYAPGKASRQIASAG